MSLNRVSVQEMATVTGRWLDNESKAREIIEGSAILKPFMEQIEPLHARLLSVRKADNVRLTALGDAATEADADHDFWVNAIVTFCDTVDPTDPELNLGAIRQWLFPRGAVHVRDSYLAEAGHAARKAAELDAARKRELRAITIGRQTLLQWVERWLEAARQLGAIEAERRELGAPAGDDAREVRRGWLALVRAFEGAAKLAQLSDEQFQTVFGLVRDLSRKRPSRSKKTSERPLGPAEPNPAIIRGDGD